jgi:HD-GYP domain-containing protein (c-di-GMP phosphodiesterase class II)
MALISLSTEHLRLCERLPFGLYDGNGLLLLPSGALLDDPNKLKTLKNKQLFVTDDEAGTFHRWMGETVERLVLKDATLKHIAQARFHAERTTATAAKPRSLTEVFELQMRTISVILRDAEPTPGWLQSLKDAAQHLRETAEQAPDALLFLLIQHASHEVDHYSAHHAVLCMLVSTQIARLLRWPQTEIDTLIAASITMNVAMTPLQDTLARQRTALSAEQRALVDKHALASTSLLAAAGVKDAHWLKAVRLHHDETLVQRRMDELDVGSRIARLLGMVDRFTAKISRRAGRAPLSPLIAAQKVCVRADGQPDEVGGAMIRALGMYPPGCYVRLANQEVGVVVARGPRSNEPVVAALVGSSGMALSEPVLRQTGSTARAVVEGVAVKDIRVRINQQRVLDLL